MPTIAEASTTLHVEAEPALGAVRLAIAEMRGGARAPVYLPPYGSDITCGLGFD